MTFVLVYYYNNYSINFEIGNLAVCFANVCTFYVPFLYAVRYNYIKL